MENKLMTLEEMREHEWLVGWSGGKDSTATVILMKEHNIPVKKIVYVRMMYDYVTPATIPEMDDFIAHASDIFSIWGYKVETVYTKHTAIELANKVKKRSKYLEDIGKPYGIQAFSRGRCWLTSEKVAAIKRSISKYYWHMIGYGVDETKRVKSLGGGQQSILVALNLMEKDAYAICERYGLLAPTYQFGLNRDGCFFCPNVAKAQREWLHAVHPELVEKAYDLVKISLDTIRSESFPNVWVKDYIYHGGDTNENQN